MPVDRHYLRRYTDLPALLNLLETSSLTLLSPQSWDDANDRHFLEVYRKRRNLASVLALCFTTENAETYHHWRVFSQGSSGVCITFDRAKLLQALGRRHTLLSGNVRYRTLVSLADGNLRVRDLPFVKRIGFKPENEFRILYESATEALPALDIPVTRDVITHISLSPWLHPDLRDATVKAIRSAGSGRIPVSRSTLTSNQQWKEFGEEAT